MSTIRRSKSQRCPRGYRRVYVSRSKCTTNKRGAVRRTKQVALTAAQRRDRARKRYAAKRGAAYKPRPNARGPRKPRSKTKRRRRVTLPGPRRTRSRTVHPGRATRSGRKY